MTKHLKPIDEKYKPVYEKYLISDDEASAFVVPERSKWQVHLFGDSGIIYRPLKGKEPNWFWRKMQFLILGNRWVKDDD